MKVMLKIESGALDGEHVCSAFDAQGERVACTVSVFVGKRATKVYAATNSAKAKIAFARIIRVIADRDSWAGGSKSVSAALETWATGVLLVGDGNVSNN